MATAVQLKRYGIDHLVIEKNRIGGLLRNANLVENYIGFPQGITGVNLIKLFEEQVRKLRINVLFEEVKNLDFQNKSFLIETYTQSLYSPVVVVASGTRHKQFVTCNITEEVQDKIFYEIEPIMRVENKKIVIVGAGDIAFDYALHLSQNNEVVILNKSDEVKCLPLLWERAKTSDKISYKDNTKISEIIKTSHNMLTINIKNSSGTHSLCANYVIFAIGREAQLSFLSKNIKNNKHKLNNLYFAGDVKNGLFRQVAIATGDGIKVAMEINSRLKEA